MNLSLIRRDLGTVVVLIALFIHQPEMIFHLYGMLRHKVCREFIKSLELSKEEVQELEQAVFLHDIGKLGVSLSILNSPLELSKEQYDEVKKHAWIGADIAQGLGYNDRIIQAVRQHHERINGGGYPDQLVGKEICLYAKVIALLDSFDVMRRGRIYKKAMTKAEIIHDLQSGPCSNFDKELVQRFVCIVEKELNN